MSESEQVLEGVAYEADVRFVAQWGAAGDHPAREHLLNSTLHVLEAINALEEPLPERRMDDAPWHADIVRIDRRLNLLLVMVARLLAKEDCVEKAVPVRLYSNGMSWRANALNESARPGMPLVCLLYLPSFPTLPVALPATFAGTVPGNDDWVYARFAELSESVAEQLDHLIFRHHRRRVAERRSNGENDAAS